MFVLLMQRFPMCRGFSEILYETPILVRASPFERGMPCKGESLRVRHISYVDNYYKGKSIIQANSVKGNPLERGSALEREIPCKGKLPIQEITLQREMPYKGKSLLERSPFPSDAGRQAVRRSPFAKLPLNCCGLSLQARTPSTDR